MGSVGGDETSPVVLVNMPWSAVGRPSLALGILSQVLADHGVRAATRSFQLAFAEHVVAATAADARPITLDDYTAIADDTASRGHGDWVFAVEPYRAATPAGDEAYFAVARADADRLAVITRLRELVPAFLAACADDILALAPRIVGFTTTFSQSISSLVLARMLKHRAPALTIVFGGAACEGAMGAALHRSFPWVDVVVRGEGEAVFPAVVADVLAGRAIRDAPGLCHRTGDAVVHCAEAASRVAMDTVPIPDFGEFFDRVEASPLEAAVRRRLRVPYESARGCWWGAKNHCTFCGLNGATMAFRSKSPARVVDDIRAMAARYQALDFYVVDNIIDMDYFDTVLPELARTGWNLKLFFETKANLRLEHVRELHRAGVATIQPGIESLSTPILKLMRKGVTALQNIRLLKWCAAYRIDVLWNLIYGFPGEPPEEYARMAGVIGALGHLAPPSWSRLRIDRFSPYFDAPADHGLRVTTPLPYHAHVYPVDAATLFDLAYFFTTEYIDGRDPATYARPVVEAVDRWRADSAGGYRALRYRRGPDFIVIDDLRPGLGPRRFELDAIEAAIYLACDAGATPAAVHAALGELGAGVDRDEVRGFLDELTASALVYCEGDRYLSLAIPERAEDLHQPEAVAPPRLAVVR